MKINYNGKDIFLEYFIIEMLMYENVKSTDQGDASSIVSLTDVITLFWCYVVSCSNDYSITFDDFINWIDKKPEVLIEYNEWLQKIVAVNNQLKKK